MAELQRRVVQAPPELDATQRLGGTHPQEFALAAKPFELLIDAHEMQLEFTTTEVSGSQAQVLVDGLYTIPLEQLKASQVRVIPFHQRPELQAQLLGVAVPFEPVTVEQRRHWLVPEINRYPEAVSQKEQVLTLDEEVHARDLLGDEDK